MDCAVTDEAMVAAVERLVAVGGAPPTEDDVEMRNVRSDEGDDIEMVIVSNIDDQPTAVDEPEAMGDELECECGWADAEDVESEDEQADFAFEVDANDADEADAADDDGGTAESAAPLAMEEGTRPVKRQQLKVREREILEQLPGQEASGSGLLRTWKQEAQRPGIFSASNYFYLYYALLPMRPDLVQVVSSK